MMNKDLDLDNEFVAKPRKKSGYKLLLFSFSILILLGLYAYRIFLPDEETYHIPIIEADDDLVKIKPLDPGGERMSHMDKDVYNNIAKHSEHVSTENLLPGPETPIDNSKECIALIDDSDRDKSHSEENKVSTELIEINSKGANKKSLKNIAQEREAIKKPSDVRYRVQIAAIKSREQAEKEWNRLSAKHKMIFGAIPHFIEKKNLANRGVYYCIHVGEFKKYSDAQNMCKRLLEKNQNCVVLEN